MTRQLFGSRKRAVARRPNLAAAVGQRIERRRRVPRVDLAQFVENKHRIACAGRRALKPVRRRAPGPHIAGRAATPPNARRQLQERRLAPARLAAEMDAAAFLPAPAQAAARRAPPIWPRTGKAWPLASVPTPVLPVLQRSARLIGAMRRRVENDRVRRRAGRWFPPAGRKPPWPPISCQPVRWTMVTRPLTRAPAR